MSFSPLVIPGHFQVDIFCDMAKAMSVPSFSQPVAVFEHHCEISGARGDAAVRRVP